MPTEAGHEGTRVAGVRGQWLPTVKTQDQDSVRALTSLSADGGSCGPRRDGVSFRDYPGVVHDLADQAGHA